MLMLSQAAVRQLSASCLPCTIPTFEWAIKTDCTCDLWIEDRMADPYLVGRLASSNTS